MTEDVKGIPLLNREFAGRHAGEFSINSTFFDLPEKVIQFGTGRLLRGLVDYLIDKANKKDRFNGRVVVVKSTGNDVDEFTAQDNLFTILEKGLNKGKSFEEKNIVTCVSRVLPAQQQWQLILECAADAAIEIIVSNTTEAGLVFREERVDNEVPNSFPAKLTAYLWQRYKAFNGDKEKGVIILPTELISKNGDMLKQFVLQHASGNDLPRDFSEWISKNNYFCNTLVDRIVPGKSEKNDVIHWNDDIRYADHLHTTVEPYLLWAIEGNEIVKQKLSFIEADTHAIVTGNIEGFKEQKLRILNGSNSAVVAPAYLAGLTTTYDTIADELFAAFTQQMIYAEILPTIMENCPTAPAFAKEVVDRFANPFIRYPLLNVALQYSGKMNNRNTDTIIRYYKKFNTYPPLMSVGLAAFFLFYTPAGKENDTYFGMRNGEKYIYRDENTTFLCSTLEEMDWSNLSAAEKSISTVIDNADIFSPELASLPGIVKLTASLCCELHEEGIRTIIEKYLKG